MQWDAVTQRLLLVQPLNLAREVDAINTFSAFRVANGADFLINDCRKFV
jgi:hypothetical protein